MAKKSWLDATDNWNTGGDWTGGVLPGVSDDVVIGQGTPTVTGPITAVHSVSIASAGLDLENANTTLATGSVSNAGTLNVDVGNPSGAGSKVTIGGTLSNSGTINIGYYGNSNALTTTVTANALITSGAINLVTSFWDNSHEVLKIKGAAATVLMGSWNVGQTGGTGNGNSARIQFGSGGIKTIAAGASLSLYGTQAFVALASNVTSNSALNGLSLNAGTIVLQDGSLTTTTALTNVGEFRMIPQAATAVVNLGGVVTNFGSIHDDSYGGGGQPTFTAKGLNNFGTIAVAGNGVQQAVLDIDAAAPNILIGSIAVGEDFPSEPSPALLKFKSGTISAIGAGARLSLVGPNAFFANGSNVASNSALSGLARNDGNLLVKSGAKVTTTTDLVNLGSFGVDTPHYGGSTFSIGGSLTNFNAVVFGSTDSPAASHVSATGCTNFGSLDLYGSSAANSATFAVDGANNFCSVNIHSFGKIAGGSYTQSGGLTTVTGSLKATSVSLRGGTLDIDGALTATTMALSGGLLQGAGTLSGDLSATGGIVVGGLVADNYYFRYGFFNAGAPGTLTVKGDFAETNGSVLEFLRGTASGQSSTIKVTGNVQLSGGTLLVDVGSGSGFQFAAGQAFTVMSFAAGKLSGTFAHLQCGPFLGSGSSVNIGGGLSLKAVYNNAAGNIQLKVVNTPASGDHWTATTPPANDLLWWDVAGNWANGAPGASTDAIVDNTANFAIYFRASTSVHSITNANLGASLNFDSNTHLLGNAFETPSMTVSVAGSLSNAGGLNVDNTGPYAVGGGTTLNIGGTLANGGSLVIGNRGNDFASTINAGVLINTGNILLQGAHVVEADPQPKVVGSRETINIAGAAGFGTQGTVTGSVRLNGDTRLIFGSGQITSIEAGAELSLHDSRSLDGLVALHALVADAADPTHNSALAGLGRNAGHFQLVDGPKVTTTGDLVNSGGLDVDHDGPYGAKGGSALSIGGTLTNTGTVNIGAGTGMTRGATLNAAAVINAGQILLQGGNPGVRATLKIAGSAGFGAAGTLTGSVEMSGDSLLKFGSGQITSLGSGASLTLHGSHSFIAVGGSTTSNSALAGLSSIDAAFGSIFPANFRLLEGASVATTAALTNAGQISVDENGPYGAVGGSALSIGGALANNGGVSLGMTSITANSSLTVAGLTNTSSGTVGLTGGDGQNGHVGHATMAVNGASTNDGTITAAHGSTLLLNGAVVNYGAIKALGGEVDVAGAATGTGSYTVGDGGLLKFAGSSANAEPVAFTGDPAALTLQTPASYRGNITGFATGDVMDLVGEVVTALSYSGSVLKVTISGGGTQTFNLSGSFPGLAATSDGSGGTDITAVASPFPLTAGKDLVAFLGGDDTFAGGSGFAATDKLNGGAGIDTLILKGDYSAGVVFGSSTLVDVERVTLGAGHSYKLTTANATVAAGQTLTVGAAALGSASNLVFNGAAEIDGAFVVTGGAGLDSITGGAGDDLLVGGAGADTLRGGSDSDIFRFKAGDSAATVAGFDTVQDFEPGVDKIDLSIFAGPPSASAYAEISVASNNFATVMSAAESQMGAGVSAVFVAGSTNGWLFWNTDANPGTADQALQLSGSNSLGAFERSDLT